MKARVTPKSLQGFGVDSIKKFWSKFTKTLLQAAPFL
jgi:hypothetical protein